MERTDLVLELVDARLPEASANPLVHALRTHRQRPCLKVLNKADLADPAVTGQWLHTLRGRPGTTAVALSCRLAGEAAKVLPLCRSLAPHRDSPAKPLRIMVMGIPNVGKSTLVNALVRRRVARVGDEPAVTRAQQGVELDTRTRLVDTPGLLWPRIAHDSDGYMLAASHAVGVNAVPEEAVAVFLARLLLERYAARLETRYGLKAGGLDGEAVLEAVARRRGCVLRGGGLDLEKAARILLGDYRQGALGRVSLETPASRAAMLAAEGDDAAHSPPPDPAGEVS